MCSTYTMSAACTIERCTSDRSRCILHLKGFIQHYHLPERKAWTLVCVWLHAGVKIGVRGSGCTLSHTPHMEYSTYPNSTAETVKPKPHPLTQHMEYTTVSYPDNVAVQTEEVEQPVTIHLVHVQSVHHEYCTLPTKTPFISSVATIAIRLLKTMGMLPNTNVFVTKHKCLCYQTQMLPNKCLC